MLLGFFFALNIGASNAAAVMTGIYKGKLLNLFSILFLFAVFAAMGAMFSGEKVITTVSTSIVPETILNSAEIFIILVVSSLIVFVGNVSKIPLSTTQILVGSFIGIGAAQGVINTGILQFLICMWLLIPLVSFGCTYILEKYTMSTAVPKPDTRIYLVGKWFSLATAAYMAYATGANNAGNAVGPLVAANLFSVQEGTLLCGLLIGLGGILFGGPIIRNVVKNRPNQMESVTGLMFINATLILLMTWRGLPGALVQLALAGLWGRESARSGFRTVFMDTTIWKTFIFWILAPMFSFSLAYISEWFIH